MDRSVEYAARVLGVSSKTIRNWIKAGRFPGAYKLDPSKEKSSYKIPDADITSLLLSRKSG